MRTVEQQREYRATRPLRARQYQATYRLRHPGREAASAKRSYERKREAVKLLKSVPCRDCGGRFPPYVMDFDHRDPSSKRFEVSQYAGWGMRQLLAEAAKCDIVCANCHRERTHGTPPPKLQLKREKAAA